MQSITFILIVSFILAVAVNASGSGVFPVTSDMVHNHDSATHATTTTVSSSNVSSVFNSSLFSKVGEPNLVVATTNVGKVGNFGFRMTSNALMTIIPLAIGLLF